VNTIVSIQSLIHSVGTMISDRLCRLRKGKDGDGPLELWRTVQHDASVHERLVRPSPLHPPISSSNRLLPSLQSFTDSHHWDCLYRLPQPDIRTDRRGQSGPHRKSRGTQCRSARKGSKEIDATTDMSKNAPPLQLPVFDSPSIPPSFCISIPLSHFFGSTCPHLDNVLYTPVDISIIDRYCHYDHRIIIIEWGTDYPAGDGARKGPCHLVLYPSCPDQPLQRLLLCPFVLDDPFQRVQPVLHSVSRAIRCAVIGLWIVESRVCKRERDHVPCVGEDGESS
jgi:hypothetical protein